MSGTRRKPGRLGPFVEGYRAWLLERGYTPQTTRGMLKELGRAGALDGRAGRRAGRAGCGGGSSVLAARRAAGQRRVRACVRCTRWSRSARGGCHGTRADGPGELTPLERLVAGYRGWLVGERGLAEPTVIRYERLARRFLAGRVSDAGELGVAGLTGADVSAFLLAECARVSVGSAKGRVAELRSLLRFLYLRGFTEQRWPTRCRRSRAGATPRSRPRWRPPKLSGCWTRATGRRSAARATSRSCCCSRGSGCARSRSRGWSSRTSTGAPASSWCAARRAAMTGCRCPPTSARRWPAIWRCAAGADSRHVFLTVKAPTRPIRADLVGDVVQRACLRAGVAHVGAHRLRHTLASELLRAGRVAGRHQPGAAPQRPGHHRRSTPRSISAGCARSRGRGRERRDERAGPSAGGLPAAAARARPQARRRRAACCRGSSSHLDATGAEYVTIDGGAGVVAEPRHAGGQHRPGPADDGRARVRPLPRRDRPAHRGPTDRAGPDPAPAASAVHLHRRRRAGVDGRKRAARSRSRCAPRPTRR